MAWAEADAGTVPRYVADGIAGAARLGRLDLGRMLECVARTSHPLMPLIEELARTAGQEAGGWVHWGATTPGETSCGNACPLHLRPRTQVKRGGC